MFIGFSIALILSFDVSAKYQKYDKNSCKEGIRVEKEIIIDDLPRENLNQKNLGTCYAFSVSQHLESYLRSQGNFEKNCQQYRLSVVDIMSKSCPRFLKEGGSPSRILMDILQNPLVKISTTTTQKEYEKALELYKFLDGEASSIDQYLQLGSLQEKLKHNSRFCEKSYDELSEHRDEVCKSFFNEQKSEALEIPTFNVHVLESSDIQEIQNKVESFITQERRSLIFNQSDHSMVVLGSRLTCCARKCHSEFLIKNSYGDKDGKNGWFLAEPLMNNFESLVWLRRCSNSSSIKCQNIPLIESKFPLHYLANEGDISSLMMMLEDKKNENSLNARGVTILQIAVLHSNFEMVQKIVESGKVDIKFRSISGRNALLFAIHKNDLQIFEYLIQKGNLSKEDWEDLRDRLILEGNVRALKYFFKIRPEFLLERVINDDEYNLFVLAVNSKNTMMVDYIHELGGNLESSFLYSVIENGDGVMFNHLMDLGLSLDVVDNEGNNLLHSVILKNQLDMIDVIIPLKTFPFFLKTEDSKCRSLNNLGQTPLHLAVETRDPLPVNRLLNAGCDPKNLDRDGQTILHRAVDDFNFEIIQLLLEYDPNLKTIKNSQGISVIENILLKIKENDFMAESYNKILQLFEY